MHETHVAVGLYAHGRASIDALQSRSDLNGFDCTLLAWHGQSGRWAVEVHETGENLRLRPSNLIAFHNSWAVPDHTPAIQEVLFTRIDWNSRARLGATCKSWRSFVATHNAQSRQLAYACKKKDTPARLIAAIRQCPLVQELVLHEPEAAIVLSACECLGTRLRVLRLEGLAKATNSLFTGIASNNSNLLVLEWQSWSMMTGIIDFTIEPMLRSCRTLLDLDLTGNCDVATVEVIAKGCRCLRRLGIGGAGGEISDERFGAGTMSTFMHAPVSSLGDFHKSLTERFNDAIVILGAANPALLCLDASDTCMENGGLSGLTSTGLLHLNLSQCGCLSDAALEVIASGMPALQLCDLSFIDKGFTDVGIKAMLGLSGLRHLGVQGCGCISEETKQLCPQMESMAYTKATIDLQRRILRDHESSLPTDISDTDLDAVPVPTAAAPAPATAVEAPTRHKVGDYVQVEGLATASHLNGCAGIVVALGADGKCGVHVLKHNKDVRISVQRLVVPTLSCSLEHLCMALATNERTGSINHDVYNRHVFTDPSNMMMNLGLVGMGQATRAPTLPDIRDFVDAQQHRDALNHMGRPAACNCTYFALKYCAQAAYSKLISMRFTTSSESARQSIDKFLGATSPLAFFFFEMDGLAGLHHSRQEEWKARFPQESFDALDAHAFTVARCEGRFRFLHSCAGLFTWQEQLSGSEWVDAAEARTVLYAMIELTLQRPHSATAPSLARALMAGYTLQPSATYGRDQPEDPQLGLVSVSVDPRAFLRAGHRLLQEMRRQGL